jgi:hypothetical protein
VSQIHNSIISCSIFRDRTARIALLSRLKGIEGRVQKVCGNSWQVSAVPVSRSPCGPKKNCSTIAFGSRALKISSICRPAPSNKEENDKFAGQILPPSVVHQASVTLVSCPPLWMSGSRSKHLEVTKQGDPENLRRKFASKGSSPRHLCIEQALNLADRYRRVGRLSTCGCIQRSSCKHRASLGLSSRILGNHPLLVRFEFAVPACNAAKSSGRHPGPPATTSPDHPNHECFLLCKVSSLGASKVVDPHQFVTALLLWTLPGSLWWILT